MRTMLVAILLAFSSLSLAASNPPTGQHQPQPAKPNSKPKADERGTQSQPLVIQGMPAAKTQQEAEADREHEKAKASNEILIAWGTVVLAGITGLLVIVTGILALFTYRLWRETRNLAIDAKTTSDRQAGEMQKSLAIAEKSADAATRTVETMESIAERQLRAYVFCTHDGKPIATDSKGARFVTLVINNYGQTPANELQCSAFIGLQQFPLNVKLDPPDYTNGSKSSLAHGEPIKQFPTLPGPLNNLEIETIGSGKAAIFVWGEIVYFDIFKKRRRTSFCLYSTGDDFTRGELAYHHEGNDAD